jgi:hypothetical protein
METDHKYTCTSRMKLYYNSTIKNMVKVPNFKVISDTVNLQIYAVRIYGKTITARRTGTASLLTASVFYKTQIQ